MSHKIKKFERMVRGNPIKEECYEKETIEDIKLHGIHFLKQLIVVNSLSHISNEILSQKCSDITTHYRLFKDNEHPIIAQELSDDEKDELKRCIDECINKECARIINEKESIPSELLALIESNSSMPITLRNKFNNLLSLLTKYTNNKKEINSSVLKLLNSSDVNILEAQKLIKQIDTLKAHAHMLQNNIIKKFSSPDKLFETLEKYYNTKEKDYAANVSKLESMQQIQEKYKEVDGPQYRALVKKFIQAQEIIKIKTEMFNSY